MTALEWNDLTQINNAARWHIGAVFALLFRECLPGFGETSSEPRNIIKFEFGRVWKHPVRRTKESVQEHLGLEAGALNQLEVPVKLFIAVTVRLLLFHAPLSQFADER